MNSGISEMPGPEVAVKARAPFQAAPITMPIEASSSSAWMIADFACLVVGSTRNLAQWRVNASVGERRRRREQIPRAHRGVAVHRAQRRRGVALDENAITDLVGLAQLDRQRTRQVQR